MVLQELYIAGAAVLQAPVRMMDQPLVHQVPFQGHLQGLDASPGGEILAQVKNHDLMAVGIGDQALVSKALLQVNVGDVAYPQLVSSGRYQTNDQVAVLAQPMTGEGGLRPGAFASPNQQALLTQELKKSVTAYTNAMFGHKV